MVTGDMVAILKEKSPLMFQYEVKNLIEKEVTLKFSSSQRYDFSVETETGEQIYLFSSVAMFMAVLGEEIIKQGETLRYDIDLHELDLKPGNYLLKVWMTPKEGKVYKVTKKFTIE
jgi:Intracellular proteinase inhibitor